MFEMLSLMSAHTSVWFACNLFKWHLVKRTIQLITNNSRQLSVIKHIVRDEDYVLSTLKREYDSIDMRLESTEITVDRFSSIATDQQTMSKIELILYEYECEKYATAMIPTTLTVENMSDLLDCDTSEDRVKMFHIWFDKEGKHLDLILERKRRLTKQISQYLLNRNCGVFDRKGNIIYGQFHNTLLNDIKTPFNRRIALSNLMSAANFGQKLIIDLDFDKLMRYHECVRLCDQIYLVLKSNRNAFEPFDIHFTNCNFNGHTMRLLRRYLNDPELQPLSSSFHHKSYLNLFAFKDLFYLTPHAKDTLETFNHNHIYIIGGINDFSFQDPVDYIKAKEEGIRTLKFPVDGYLMWNYRYRKFLINQTFSILRDVKSNDEWSTAFKRHIPEKFLNIEKNIKRHLKKVEKHSKRLDFINYLAFKDHSLNNQ